MDEARAHAERLGVENAGDPNQYWLAASDRDSPLFDSLLGLEDEIDIDVAHAGLKREIERAKATDSPPYFPPAEFEPGLSETERLAKWRDAARFPGLFAAESWVIAICMRAADEVQPVTLAEFDALAGWYQANKRACRRWAFRNKKDIGYVPLGDVEVACRQGGRGPLAGKAAELMRALRRGVESGR